MADGGQFQQSLPPVMQGVVWRHKAFFMNKLSGFYFKSRPFQPYAPSI